MKNEYNHVNIMQFQNSLICYIFRHQKRVNEIYTGVQHV